METKREESQKWVTLLDLDTQDHLITLSQLSDDLMHQAWRAEEMVLPRNNGFEANIREAARLVIKARKAVIEARRYLDGST